jgi:serine/threonine-protein kinase PpkA
VIRVPGYLIKREIGVGGMARVYLAVQTSLEREVALKVMNPIMISDPSFSRRFMQEARTLASLEHPNIVSVYDVGITEEELHYFSMQHLSNGDFLKRIRKKNGLDEHEVLRVISGVARALGYAHQRGFVHRDVAPGNVIFDSNDTPVLTDFGIARSVSKTSRITHIGVSVGTSHYMSPEQARGGEVDGRSDIYSLGALTFEAITGNPPYDGEDGFAIAYAHVFEPVPRLPANRSYWQALIDRAMAKNPAERFQSMEEFLLELDRLGPQIGTAEPSSDASSEQSAGNLSSLAVTASQPADPDPENKRSEPLVDSSALPVTTVITKVNEKVLCSTDPLFSTSDPSLSNPDAVVDKLRTRKRVATICLLGIVLIGAGIWWRYYPPPQNNALHEMGMNLAGTVVDSEKPLSGMPVGDESDARDTLAMAGVLELDPLATEQYKHAVATTVIDPVAALLYLARNDLAAKRLSQPAGRNAVDRYQLVLKIEPGNAEAKAGLLHTGQALALLATQHLSDHKLAEWIEYSARAIEVTGPYDSKGEIKAAFKKQKEKLLAQLLDKGQKALEKWDGAAAKAAFSDALIVSPRHSAALSGIKKAKTIGKPGYIFSDAIGKGMAPSLVISSVGGKRLAISQTEIKVEDFRRFWNAAEASTRANRPVCRDRESIFRGSRSRTWQAPGFEQTGNHPVVCVNWHDAKAYVDWLSKASGKRYRLLTAAEWSSIAKSAENGNQCRANVGDKTFHEQYRSRSALACSDGYAQTAPVGKFSAVASIYDLAGNVREWVSDCAADCRKHLAMGSTWSSVAEELQVTQRNNFDADTAFNTVGFRVAREID